MWRVLIKSWSSHKSFYPRLNVLFVLLHILQWRNNSPVLFCTWSIFRAELCIVIKTNADVLVSSPTRSSKNGATASSKSFPNCLKAVLPSQSARSLRFSCRRRCAMAAWVFPLPSPGKLFQCSNWRRHEISSSTLRSFVRGNNRELGMFLLRRHLMKCNINLLKFKFT